MIKPGIISVFVLYGEKCELFSESVENEIPRLQE